MKIAQKLTPVFTGATLLVLLGIAISFWIFRQAEKSAEVRQQTHTVINGASELFDKLRDAEIGQRGYLLTGNEAFLAPYLAATNNINGDLGRLHQLTDNTAAQKILDTLTPLIDAKLQVLSKAIELRRNHDAAGALALVADGSGKKLMDDIRIEFKNFMAAEESLQEKQEKEFQLSMRRMFVVIVVASLLLLLLMLLLGYRMFQEALQRTKNLVHLETTILLKLQETTNNQLEHANLVLQDKEEKLSVTLCSIGDAVIATDANGCVALMNPVAEKLTGWTQAEAEGHAVSEIFNIINKATRKPSLIPVGEALAHGTTQGLANHTLLIARDGTEYDIADSCAPIRDRNNEVVGAVLVFRNVTKEYVLQKALNDSAALVQNMLNTVADGIITFHANDGAIQTVNQAAEKMFGYSALELSRENFSILVPELVLGDGDGELSLKHYSASAEALAVGHGREVVGLHKNGNTLPIEIAVSEMWQGEQQFFTVILRDIAIRKQHEAALAQLDQILQKKNIELESAKAVAEKANLAKSDFLSSMSHELRTPLNAILGFAQLIDSGTPLPTPSQKRSIDHILQGGWYLLELINEILDLALIESGKLSLSLEPVPLTEVMHECEAMIEPQAKKHGVTIIFPATALPHCVLADRTRIKQVIINLLSNAVKYNKVGGKVIVKCTEPSQDIIRIAIEDTGEGLSAEKIAQLFQPFNRLGQESREVEGTGIGLVMTKRLIELMGGEIGLESTVGKGSVFWVDIKRTTASPIIAPVINLSVATLTSAPINHAMHTMLYIEDNPANMMLVESLIERRSDIQLLRATDGLQGIAMARASLPNFILMDINLPGINGLQAMMILAADPMTAHIPVIALSANAMPSDIEKGLQAGFFSYLSKPIKINEFMDTLELVLLFLKK
jgi:PAS domain S-box-containing protein